MLSLAAAFFGCHHRAPSPQQPRSASAASELATILESVVSATSQDEQAAAFRRIEALGCRAAPAMVAHLDDRRPLFLNHLTLVNNAPGAFEATRHYGPEVVSDAMSAILNQVTGKHFEFVYNGADEATRAKDAQEWRLLLRETSLEELCRRP